MVEVPVLVDEQYESFDAAMELLDGLPLRGEAAVARMVRFNISFEDTDLLSLDLIAE